MLRAMVSDLFGRGEWALGPVMNPRIRVAYVVQSPVIGGLQRCVANLCNHLDRQWFWPMVISLTKSGPAAQWIRRDDVPIIELHKPSGNDLGVVFRLARTLRRHRVDIVHSHNWGTLVETTLARRLARVAVHVHAERGTVLGDLEIRGVKRRVRAAAMGWALRRADSVVSNALATARRIEATCGYRAGRVRVIPNGVEEPAAADRHQTRRRVRRTLGVPADAPVVGSVGRLVPVKAFHLAIEALAQLGAPQQHGAPPHLVLVGDGPEREALRRRAVSLGLDDRVHLVGYRQDVGNWLAAMDVYVNTSLSEGMSQSIVEAMAFGLPLVVTDVGDSAVVVDGRAPCGVVVPPADVEALGRALQILLSDEPRRVALACNARSRYQACYAMPAMVAAYGKMYAELVGHSANPERAFHQEAVVRGGTE